MKPTRWHPHILPPVLLGDPLGGAPHRRRLPAASNAKQWQMLVDAAEGALALHDAQQWGLIEGGPKVDVERCEQVLTRGAAYGYKPSKDAIERFAVGLVGGGDDAA